MTALERDRDRIAKAVDRAARFCTREKAITIVAMNSRYSIAEVRQAATTDAEHGELMGFLARAGVQPARLAAMTETRYPDHDEDHADRY